MNYREGFNTVKQAMLNLGLTLKLINRLITNYETVYSSNG
jgi:hypothetical protein